jgi:hypothetical protein
MTSTKRMVQRLAVVGAFLLPLAAPAVYAQSPAGTIVFETTISSSTEEAQWTGCRVLFKGKNYDCSVSGLNVPFTGHAQVAGTVFDLKDIASLAGTYKSAGKMDLGGGHVAVQNDKKVRMVLAAFADAGVASDSVGLTVADGGMVVKLEKK